MRKHANHHDSLEKFIAQHTSRPLVLPTVTDSNGEYPRTPRHIKRFIQKPRIIMDYQCVVQVWKCQGERV